MNKFIHVNGACLPDQHQEKRSYQPSIKYLVAMKLFVLILLLSVNVCASTYSQQITLNVKNESLEKVMKSIRKQSGYYFMFSGDLLKSATPITLSLNKASIEETLQKLFKDQPFVYSIDEKLITVLPKSVENIAPPTTMPQKDLSGNVTDEKGQALIGATVILKGTNKGTTTDKDGNFLFKNVPENGKLLIRMIGHETIEVVYQNGSVKNIVLKEISADLNTVQVIAYGEVSKKFSTSSVTMVTAEEIARQPVNNPLLALQGRVPGVFISQTTGAPGSTINVTIQGINTFRPSGREPFYVVDGVPYTANFTNTSLNTNAVGLGGSTLNYINPADIESISILKDADATAIYGSRAANGAILITTKKGKSGKTKIDLNIQQGWGQVTRKLKLMNTQQYLKMRKEGYLNAGLPIPTTASTPEFSNYDLTIWDANRYTDWQKELVGGTAHFTDIRASISGGSPTTQFLIAYNYNRQTTVYPNSQADQKGNTHFNLNHNSANGKFNVMLNGSYLQNKNMLNGQDLMIDAVTMAPNAPKLFNADGSLNWEPLPNDPTVYSFFNPLAPTLVPYTSNTNNLTANNSISYEVIPNLQLKLTAGYNRLEADESVLYPINSFKPDAYSRVRYTQFLNKALSSWIIEPQAKYTRSTRFGVFDALLGGTFSKTQTNILQQTGSGYANDAQMLSLYAAPTVIIDNDTQLKYKYAAMFGRLNYLLMDRYILNLTARRDGSSRFGAENKFHTFYAVGCAWLFGDEDFSKLLMPWLSTGKIRANYGTTGNDQIDDYLYESILSNFRTDRAYQGIIGLYPTRITNAYLQWEETKKLNVGIELGFLKNKITLDINYFHNRSSNQLLSPQIASISGFSNLTQNLPATIQNKGFEIVLGATLVQNKNIFWNTSVNFTNPQNRLTKFAGITSGPYANTYFIGQPINAVRVYKFAGVNKETGLYEVFNSKGEKTYEPSYSTDRTTFIDPNPKWYGGFVNTLKYRNFQLDFVVQFVKQLAPNYALGNLPGNNINQPIYVLDRWQKKGDATNIQKFDVLGGTDFQPTITFSNANDSDVTYGDASYARLKNISLSYTLSELWTKKKLLSSARFYLQGQNLLTITNYKGLDPETKTNTVLPPLKMFTAGAQFTF